MAAPQSIKERLAAERSQLVRQLTELGAAEDGSLRVDVDFPEGFADAAAATSERTEVLGLVDSLKRSLEEVDLALARLEEGTYGTCVNCGKDIGEARLEYRPASVLCVDCKSARV
jgi:DnaK suppressor protein